MADVLEGRIAVCSRGTTSFFQKAEAAVKYGATATIIYNNTEGSIGIDLTGYTQTAPVVSITQDQGKMMRDRLQPSQTIPAKTGVTWVA